MLPTHYYNGSEASCDLSASLAYHIASITLLIVCQALLRVNNELKLNITKVYKIPIPTSIIDYVIF